MSDSTDPTPVVFSLPDEAIERIVDLVAARVLARLGDQKTGTHTGRWLSVAEAAAYARCGEQRIYNLRSDGRLSQTGDGGRALVDRRELDRLIEAGTI